MKPRGYLLVAAAIVLPMSGALANDELLKWEKDPNQWVMPTRTYDNQRYSELKQITAENVKNLHPVWSFSTGVLRGHEGAPLVDRGHHVCPHAVPEHRVRARSQG